MPRACIRCQEPFEPIASMEARLQARGSYQKVCASCAIAAINDMAAESVWSMTDEEIEAKLRAAKRDVDAWRGVLFQAIEDTARGMRDQRVAFEAIKAAIDGRRVYVTKSPEGMTLFEAQQHIDAILAPFSPRKGST